MKRHQTCLLGVVLGRLLTVAGSLLATGCLNFLHLFHHRNCIFHSATILSVNFYLRASANFLAEVEQPYKSPSSIYANPGHLMQLFFIEHAVQAGRANFAF